MLKPFHKSAFPTGAPEARFLRIVHLFGNKGDYRLVDIPVSAINHVASSKYNTHDSVHVHLDSKISGLSLRGQDGKPTDYIAFDMTLDAFHAHMAKADPVTGVVDFSTIDRNKAFWEQREKMLADAAKEHDRQTQEDASETQETLENKKEEAVRTKLVLK